MESIADYRLVRSLGAGRHGEFFLAEPPARLGLDVEFSTYPDTDHAFTNHHRPEVFHEEHTERALRRTIDFFREHVK